MGAESVMGWASPGQTRMVLSLVAGRLGVLYCVMRAFLRLVVICPIRPVCPGARVLIDVPCWRFLCSHFSTFSLLVRDG